MSGLATVVPTSSPVSWIGRKPFGTTIHSTTMPAMMAGMVNNASQRQRRTHARDFM